MYMSDNNTRTQQNPSFSSTLLDKIYRSIQEDEITDKTQMTFYSQTTSSKNHRTRTRCNSNNNRQDDDVANPNLRPAYEFQKWMDHKKKQNDKVSTKLTRRHHHQDVVFFSSSSSSSSSSDSSSGGFSSSDTESIPPIPAPVRTAVSAGVKSEKTKSREQNALFHEQRKVKHKAANHEKEKRSLKIYENLKKTKQPISPGGRLASFLNSLLMKTKKSTCSVSGQAATCPSSASSFSRSCFNKTTSSLSPPSGDGVRRTVRFYPVSVIVNEEDDDKKKSDLSFRDFLISDEEEDDDDAASDSSSDLFELDHLVVLGRNRYSEELPVYETTNLSTNRAIIANGLKV